MEKLEIISLDQWSDAETWRKKCAQTVFPTTDSWTWFKRRNRRVLVEEGVLVLGSGRMSDSVDVTRIGSVIQAIRRHESLRRVNKSTIEFLGVGL